MKKFLQFLFIAIIYLDHLVNGKQLNTLLVQRHRTGDLVIKQTIKSNSLTNQPITVNPILDQTIASFLKCLPTRPIFIAFTRDTYDCHSTEEICKGCIDVGVASQCFDQLIVKGDGLSQTHLMLLYLRLSASIECKIHQLRKDTLVWNHFRWQFLSRNKSSGMFLNSTISILLDNEHGVNLTGRLIMFHIWCPIKRKNENRTAILRISGNETIVNWKTFHKTKLGLNALDLHEFKNTPIKTENIARKNSSPSNPKGNGLNNMNSTASTIQLRSTFLFLLFILLILI